MDEAERCNWVGLLYQGRLVAHDSPAAIKRTLRGELLEFTPSRPAAASALVHKLDGVLELQTYGMMLHVFVDDAATRAPQIEAALQAEGIACGDMRRIEPRMEEAFISLIRRERAAQATVGADRDSPGDVS
jgi:ABC-2 type transport system ATP-binding protein